jgi:hypothetical protein
MYSPFFVFPYHLSLGQWYTLLLVFTHTIPGPPPGAAVAGMVELFAAGVVAAGVAAGAAGFMAGAGAPGAAAAPAGALPLSVPPYQSCTPLCPRQAPFFVAPLQ